MEFLWELALMIVLSLLLPLIFIKLLSATPNFEAKENVAVIKSDRDRNEGVKSNSRRWKDTEEEFVRIMWENFEFRENSIVRELIAPGIVDVDCEWHKKRNSRENYEEIRFLNQIELADSAVDESNQEVEPKERESRVQKIDESGRKKEVDENSGLLDDDDDWEGIERTELEKRFGAAVAFVESKRNANNLSNYVKMKLYGYHRIVTQGPCLEPHPMALKFFAPAKWNAWRQLGIMNPELAMEQYISLLSESIPDWIADYPHDNAKLASAEIPASARLTL